MKEISPSPRSSTQKVTGKNLQRVMISSGLSIALCMGCIAGSAWSLFQSNVSVESAGRLSLAGLNPEIYDQNGNPLRPVPGYTNTFLLEPGNVYKLSLRYDYTQDDLGKVWDVDALLSFTPDGSVQLLDNYDLSIPDPDPSESSEPTENPDPTEDPEDEGTGSTEETEAPEVEEPGSEVEQTQETEGEKSDSKEEETVEETTEPETVPEETTEGQTNSEGSSTEPENVSAQSEGENPDTNGEGSKTEGKNGSGQENEGLQPDGAGSDTNVEGSASEGENGSAEGTEPPAGGLTEEEEAEKKEREQKLLELQKKLENPSSGDSFDYPVRMERSENPNENGEAYKTFSVTGVKVRQNTLVTFRTVRLIPPKVAARSGALSFDTVPNYYQNDYPDTMYGDGTVASGGCSAVSLAMIATYMTDYPYLPDEMARYFGGAAESNIARLEKGLKTLEIPYEKPENIDIAYEELLKGKVGIALMGPNSLFTNSQHFIVLRGVTEDGKILVNDPSRSNEAIYSEGFREGFSKGSLTAGYQGAWLFDKSLMPEEPFIYHVPEPVHGIPRYPDIHLTASQKQVIAKIVYLEARGESPEGQQAVAEIILNRLASNRFGLTLKNVIFGEGQFRTIELLETADPYQAQYDAIERAIWGPYVLPTDVYYFGQQPITNNVWGTIGNHVFSGAPIR